MCKIGICLHISLILLSVIVTHFEHDWLLRASLVFKIITTFPNISKASTWQPGSVKVTAWQFGSVKMAD
jgi:hypothetical protein